MTETSVGSLNDFDLVELARATGRLAAQIEALQVRAIAELARRPRYQTCAGDPQRRHRHDPLKAAADEVSAVMVWTPSFADGKVRDAVELTEQLPATLAALQSGRIDGYRARVIAVAPELAEQLRRQTRANRRVDKPQPCGDGMAHMGITGPVEGLAAVWLALDAAAGAARPPHRPRPHL